MILDDLQRRALAYFVGMGWTPARAAGIVANLWAESRLNPGAVGDGGKAYGIAQWHPPRQADFAALMGREIQGSTLEDQLAFVHAELGRGERAAGEALAACTTAYAAGATVSNLYERPADAEGEAARRGALAETILAQYGATEAAPPEEKPEPVAAPAAAVKGGDAMPLLVSLLPAVLSLFAPRAQAELGRISGAPPDVVQQFAQSVIGKVSELTGKPDPLQAVAALAADPKPELVAQVQEHALADLDKLLPLLDKIEEYEISARKATIDSEDAAAARSDAKDLRPRLANWIWCGVGLIGLGLISAIILEIVVMRQKPESDLMVSFTGVITYLLARLGDVYGYAFGGVQKSGAGGVAGEYVETQGRRS